MYIDENLLEACTVATSRDRKSPRTHHLSGIQQRHIQHRAACLVISVNLMQKEAFLHSNFTLCATKNRYKFALKKLVVYV